MGGEGYPRKRERTRRRLLDAARVVLAAKGVDAASIAEIAEGAGMAPGTFYNYFQTKEEVLDAVALDLVGQFRQVVERAHERVDDPAEVIALLIRLFLGRLEDDELWGSFMARYGPSLPVLRDAMRSLVRDTVLAEGIERGRFVLDSTEAVGDLITGSAVSALNSILAGSKSPGVAEELAELILRALGVPRREAARVARRPIPRLGGESP